MANKKSGFSLFFSLIVFYSCALLDRKGGANSPYAPSKMMDSLSPSAKKLLNKALKGVNKKRLVDYHVHIVGIGTGNTGNFVHSHMQSLLHPFKYLRFLVYKNAAGIVKNKNADKEYVERLLELAKNMNYPGKFLLLAQDKHYKPDGTPDLEFTEFYTPNDYVYKIAEENPKYFEPMISIHPYRKDALQELEKWGKKGVKFLKWLPNGMGIDPSNPKIDPFYDMMKKYEMVLFTHTGEEKAIDAEEFQAFGNPLLLRRPLDRGVQVIMAHCASLGDNVDLDRKDGKRVSNFELFLRMMEDPKYEDLVFGEIAGITQFNRYRNVLKDLLAKDHLHSRLIQGSDYPLPAINMLIRTSDFHDEGFITEQEMEDLNEIFEFNPLLFDFVLKRTIRHPDTGEQFPPSLFNSPFH